ncbi:serine/threonine receptor-like kinase NFP [Aristolochia californica]|uniref:serine/threonine receptor-like kinase NFP n=1 Tax=Aristolochia californica TaxID=171875 RepID=UPI0035E068C5
MKTYWSIVFLLFFHCIFAGEAQAQMGYACSSDLSLYPCNTYAFYRAASPFLLSLASVADLFNVSPLMISRSSDISSPSSPLIPNQSLLIPITCSCTSNHSYGNVSYQIKGGDTFYLLSTFAFQNLTTYNAVELVNPSLVPTNLSIGEDVVFPIFCQCPDRTLIGNRVNYLITYTFQPSDTLSSVARKFESSDVDLLASINGGKGKEIAPFSTILVPVSEVPKFDQPIVSPSTYTKRSRNGNGLLVGLAVTLGVMCLLVFVLVGGILWYWKGNLREGMKKTPDKKGKAGFETSMPDDNFMADVSECLDKYKVFPVEELMEATMGFDESCVIEGSVYRGRLRGEVYAVKRMKWNAFEELKILQKVNHYNLVRLEGFCVNAFDGNCYLVYEYVHNGSLHSWLHGTGRTKKPLDWKTRLQIAVDVANGLLYIHQHTSPSVVHKDIKSSNILLDGNLRAKIANFGLARSGCNAVTINVVGTQGYLASEYLQNGLVTDKMDVFAFGVVLLELVSGREAIGEAGEMLWVEAERLFEGGEECKEERLRGWMDVALVEQCCSMESVANIISVARACLQRHFARRPTMVDIVYMLCKADELYFDFSEDGLVHSGIMAR